MGIRMTQHAGLNQWAQDFVRGEQVLVCHEKIERTYPDGRVQTIGPRPVRGSSVRKEEGGEFYSGMFEEEGRWLLYKYTFPNGSVYWEVVQAEPWSSGPVIFLALTAFPPETVRFWRGELERQGCEGYLEVQDYCVPESLWTDEELANA